MSIVDIFDNRVYLLGRRYGSNRIHSGKAREGPGADLRGEMEFPRAVRIYFRCQLRSSRAARPFADGASR